MPAAGIAGCATTFPNTGLTTTGGGGGGGAGVLTVSVSVAELSAGLASRSELAVAVSDDAPLPVSRTANTTLALPPFGM